MTRFADMTWLNPPAATTLHDSALHVTTANRTDFTLGPAIPRTLHEDHP